MGTETGPGPDFLKQKYDLHKSLEVGKISKMKKQKIDLKNSKNQKLVGILIDCGKNLIVIHCHGYGQKNKGKYGNTAILLSRELTRNNISNLFFDFSGFGESDGEFDRVTVSGAIDDLKSVVKYVKKLGFKNIGLSGSSFGGNIVLNYALQDSNIKAIMLKAPVSQWNLPEIETSPKIFINDIKKYSTNFANKINCPLLIIHGSADKDVPIVDSQKLCSKNKKCKLLTIKDGDHKLLKQQKQWIPEVTKYFKI